MQQTSRHDQAWAYPHSQAVLDTLPLGIVFQDPQGRITHCNAAAERILGLSLDQMRGVTSTDPRWRAMDENGADFPGERHPAMQVLRTGQPVANVVMGIFNPMTESQTWLHVSATPICDPVTTSIQAVYAVFQDISDQKRIETKLREKQAQYQVAIETTTDGFLVVDPLGKIADTNQAYSDLSGFCRGELLEMNVANLEAKEDTAQTLSHLREAVERGHDLFETLHRAKDGRVWPAEVAMTYSRAGGGRFFAFIRDISRRKEYESQTRRFEALVQSSHDAIIGLTLDGVVTSWNTAAQSLLGYAAEEVIGRSSHILFPEDRYDEQRDSLAQIRRGDDVSQIETVLLFKDGSTVEVSVSISPIRDQSGSVVGASSIVRDISEQRRNLRIHDARVRLMKYATDHSLHDLLVATLDEVCLLTHSAIGFYHFLDEDQKTLSLQAWSTRTMREYCTAAGAGTHYHVDEAGVWVDCIRQRCAIIHNDYASLPNKRGLPPGHATLVRELVIPVFRKDLIVAILGVGNKSSNYTDHDVQAVSQLADMAWDFAQTKRVEETLRESEERFQRAMEATHDGIWDWNTEDDSGYFSPSYFRMLGYEPGDFEMVRESWSSRIHPDDAMRVLKANQDCVENKVESFEVEYRMRAKDGSWKWILGRGKAFARNTKGRALRLVGTHIDITERKLSEIEINYLAHHDQLTGLPNRTLFFDRFSQAMTLAKRTERQVAMLFLDLDGFKPINDQHGHDAGDIVLKTVADRLLSAVRGIDTVGRLGGDEFAVIVGELASSQEAGLIAEKLVNVVAQAIGVTGDVQARVSASVGIAMHPADGNDLDVLLAKADAAMYQSKQRGGNRFTFWDGSSLNDPVDQLWIQLGPEHLVGYKSMDEQHRQLVDLCNTLHKSIRMGMAGSVTQSQLRALLEFVRFHFDSESRWMERFRYPGKMSHDSAHARLLADAAHFESLLHRGGDLFVLHSIKDWLMKHIEAEDRALGEFLAGVHDANDESLS